MKISLSKRLENRAKENYDNFIGLISFKGAFITELEVIPFFHLKKMIF